MRLAVKTLRLAGRFISAGIIAFCLTAGFGGKQAIAADDNISPSDLKNEIAPGVRYGGEIEIDLEAIRDFDLDGSKDDNQVTFEPQLELAVSIERPNHLMAFASIELSKEYFFQRPDGKKRKELELEIKQLFVAREFPERGTQVAFGRIDYEDPLEWIYDEELDGVRLFIDFNGPLSLQASATREELFFQHDILDPRSSGQTDNYMLWLQHNRNKKNSVAGYVFVREDHVTKKPEDLAFLGVQAIGEKSGVLRKGDEFKYWMNAAVVTGDYRSDDIWGYGIDVMGTYVFPRKWEPSITGGIAFGSGDNNSMDSTDHAFRQSGLQDNNAKLNGLTSFRYYGEVFDPELSNIEIYTAGFGLRPSKNKSIDIIYHRYHQHRAYDHIRNSNLDEDPNGMSRDLGQEIDLIVGLRPRKDIRLEFILGAFIPGDAFGPNAKNAYFGAGEFLLEF